VSLSSHLDRLVPHLGIAALLIRARVHEPMAPAIVLCASQHRAYCITL
jgi:hypothetical protein